MPEYWELLRMAELDELLGSSFVQHLKNGGVLILLAFLLLASSWGSLLIGAISRRRGLLLTSVSLAILTSAAGWVSSFIGYGTASAIVAASKATPKESELISGANSMAWAALVPTAFALVTILVALPVLIGASASKRRRAEV